MVGVTRHMADDVGYVHVSRLVESGRADGPDALSVSRLTCDNPVIDREVGFGGLDTDIAQLHLRATPAYAYTRAGRALSMTPRAAMESCLQDPRAPGVMRLVHPVDFLNFYIPGAALMRVAEDADGGRVCGLRFEPGSNPGDDTIRHLGQAILPAVAMPERATALFVDHILHAVCLYMAQTYGGLRVRPGIGRGGLAPWQERRAKELMSADLGGGLPLAALARECGLSVTHFARAFRASTGTSPHAWLIERRLDQSKSLLRQRSASLAEVALACGFADQSHFTRTFARRAGVSPGQWRRAVQTCPGKPDDGPDTLSD
jgi:AraC family transcriptional regulator